MGKRKLTILSLIVATLLLTGFSFVMFGNKVSESVRQKSMHENASKSNVINSPTILPRVMPTEISLPNSHLIPGGTHVFQTFNNCGPASLSMALSFFDIFVSQQELGNELRPWQSTSGDNDDKSVTLEELEAKAKDYGFLTYHRPNGDIKLIKSFIAEDIPVVMRTLLEEGNDIGHYRVVFGYDDTTGHVIQNDSLQGKGLYYTYDELLALWKPYGYEYLVLVPEAKQAIAERILGENVEVNLAWQNAVINLQKEVAANPNDLDLAMSLSVAYYHVGNYEKSIEVFEQIEPRLPFRTLWYQIEPLKSYQELRRYDEVLPRIENVLTNHNRAYSELYQMRGEIYLDQGRVSEAREQFELAIYYNENYEPARESLQRL